MITFIAGVLCGVALSCITVMAAIVWFDWRSGIEFSDVMSED